MGNGISDKPMEAYRMTFLDFSKEPEPKKPIVLEEFDVWMEGYAATGEHSPAHFLGKLKGRSLQDACMRYFLKKELEYREDADKKGDSLDTKRWDYNSYTNRYWACGLYNNEVDARKSFG